MKDLGDPLLLDVVERIGRVDGEADEDNVRVGVGEGTESVVVFLSGGIPKGELDALAIDHDVGNVVLEDGGDVDLWRWRVSRRFLCTRSSCCRASEGRRASLRSRGRALSAATRNSRLCEQLQRAPGQATSERYPLSCTTDAWRLTSGKVPLEKTMRRHVLPHAPSPTITCRKGQQGQLKSLSDAVL